MSKVPSYQPESATAVYVTAPDEQVAKKLAYGMVENKLAVCINILPKIVSIYEWEGKVSEDIEVLMMIKTKTSKIDELSKYVQKNHPFAVPKIISTPIENENPLYLKWIEKMSPSKDNKEK